MITPTPIKLDRERNLIFDFASFRAIQKATGHNVLADGFPVSRLDDSDVFVACLHAGLLRDDPSLSVEDVLSLLDTMSMVELKKASDTIVMAAIASFSPPTTEDEGSPDPKANR